MTQALPPPRTLQFATGAVVAYALHALAPEFLCWDKDVLLLDLDVRHERGDLFFTFELSFDQGETFHACELAVDFAIGSPVGCADRVGRLRRGSIMLPSSS